MQSASRSCMIMNENTDVISITLQGHRATSRAGQRADRSIHSAAEFQLAERAIGRRCHRAPSGLRCHMAIRRLELPLSPYACHERTRIDHGSRDREGRWATRLALPCSAPSCRKSAALHSNRLSEPLCADGARLLNVRRVDHSVVRFQRRRHRGSSEKQPWPHSSLEKLKLCSYSRSCLIWILV